MSSHADDPQLEDLAAADAPESPVHAAPAAPVPTFYTRVDLGEHLAPAAFLPLEKHGAVYAAPLAAPLLVQTPPVTLASDLVDDDGAPASHAYLLLPRPFVRFAQDVEERVADACVANKADWFRRRPVSDDALRAGFKEFCKASGHLKVKVPADALVFDEEGGVLDRGAAGAGATVRALLLLDRVCFGRTEFGAMWSLVQAQVAPPPPPPPRCMIDPAAEGCHERPGAAPAEDPEFL